MSQAQQEDQVRRLLYALCARLAEVLPTDDFDVTVERGEAVRILGKGLRTGDSLWLTPTTIWRTELPVEERLELFLEQVGQRLQRFIARGCEGRWPTMAARPRVSIDDDRILVWWGGPEEGEAEVALRPIVRREIGV